MVARNSVSFFTEEWLEKVIAESLAGAAATSKVPYASAKLAGDVLGYSLAIASAVWIVDALD